MKGVLVMKKWYSGTVSKEEQKLQRCDEGVQRCNPRVLIVCHCGRTERSMSGREIHSASVVGLNAGLCLFSRLTECRGDRNVWWTYQGSHPGALPSRGEGSISLSHDYWFT